ncbi:MAG TPA: hypothetical protein VMP00_06655 [Burkholderiales bacterium]|nr:hypothetical protein [Burkholderiales bacterium]
MRLAKRPQPLGVCNVCGALAADIEFINQRCHKVVHGRRCYGIFKSELTHVWAECLVCNATGKVGTQACDECAGWGWRLIA